MNQAPMCDNCGHIMVRESGLYFFKCLNCGFAGEIEQLAQPPKLKGAVDTSVFGFLPPDEVPRVQPHEHFEVKVDFGPVEKKSSIGSAPVAPWPAGVHGDPFGDGDIELSDGECPFCPAARFHRSICNGCRRDRRRPLPLEERVVFEEGLGATPLGFLEWGWKARDPATYVVVLGPTREEAFKQLRKRIDELETAHAVIPGEHVEDFGDPEPWDPEAEAEDDQELCAECGAYDCLCDPEGFFVLGRLIADVSCDAARHCIMLRRGGSVYVPTFRSCFEQVQQEPIGLAVYYFGPGVCEPLKVWDSQIPVEFVDPPVALLDRFQRLGLPQRHIDDIIETLHGPQPGGRRA